MLKRNCSQLDFFTLEVYSKLLPKDHLLVQIDQLIDFELLFEKMSVKYSNIGRGSKDPVMMIKIMLLEYIYGYSDVQTEKFIQTDIAIRWYLGLNLDEKGPDASTISHFRVNRMTEKDTQIFFNEIVKIGIDSGVVKTQRFIVDTTDVAANVNYPSEKKLIHKAFENLIKLIEKDDPLTAVIIRAERTQSIKELKLIKEDYSTSELALVLRRIIESVPNKKIEYYIQKKGFNKAYTLLFDLFEQQFGSKGNKIVSVVDPEARIAHKSIGNIKKGYKNHIVIDEESEIIISSLQTPFNVKDEKKLIEIVEKAEHDHGLKPKEISGDKAYGTYEIRKYLEERNIQGHMAFYKSSSKEHEYFGIEDFKVSDDLEYVICPAGQKTYNYTVHTRSFSVDEGELYFKFPKDKCKKCPLNNQCVRKKKDAKSSGARTLRVDLRYDIVLRAKTHNETKAFKTALNRRSIVERRFATLVRNHNLRRSRFIGMMATSKHILLANTACNVIRLLKLFQQSNSCSHFAT